MGKKVGVTIQHPDVWEEFKKFVVNKWGKKHTMMALELESALRCYMKHPGDTHTHTHESKENNESNDQGAEISPTKRVGKNDLMYVNNPDNGGNHNNGGSEVEKLPDPKERGIPPSEKTKRRIILHLKRTGMLDAERINENAVKKVIGMEAGYDSRTINKYFNILEDEFLLSHIEYLNIRDSRKLW